MVNSSPFASAVTLLACIGMHPAQAQAPAVVNCTEYQASHTFGNTPITMDYVVTVNETSPTGGLFSARVTYEGQGYVAIGFSTEGRMIGSTAVIGLPDSSVSSSNPAKYDMTSYTTSGVTLMTQAQQTLQDATVVQNDTHTVLQFSKYLIEDGEVAIDATTGGSTIFLAAAGYSNTLAVHQYRVAAGLILSACQEGALVDETTGSGTSSGSQVVEIAAVDNKESLFKAHGILAALAWGILAPLAIANVMCRHLIPGQGVWFQLHRGLNAIVLVLTTISFAVVVKAYNDLAGEGGYSPHHFESSPGAMEKHRTIGLVVFIVVVLQCIGGMIRPHPPNAGGDGKPSEQATTLRVVWEVAHRVSGMALLAMAWYQCHSGLVLYAKRFSVDDYTDVFWGIAGAISGVAVLGKTHGILTADKNESVDGTARGEQLPGNGSSELQSARKEEDVSA